MGITQIQGPQPANLIEVNNHPKSLLQHMIVLAARGGNRMLPSARRYCNLLTTADSPETLAAGVEAFKQ